VGPAVRRIALLTLIYAGAIGFGWTLGYAASVIYGRPGCFTLTELEAMRDTQERVAAFLDSCERDGDAVRCDPRAQP